MSSNTAMGIYRGACLFVLLFGLAHVLALPVEITYDGLGYIDMADVLGSSRFPQEWNATRTPLFPAALKAGFWILGRQPLVPIALSSGLGIIGILLLGGILRRMAGDLTAAAAMVFVSLFPILVTYQHSVLTEAGSFFFLALICRIALIPAQHPRALWLRAALLALALSVAYYWRQNILSIAPVIAMVLGVVEWRADSTPSARASAVGRAALILLLPYALSWPWNPYLDASGLRTVTLHQGMIRQALLPPEDPYVGENAGLYAQAIQESVRGGNFYSGVTWDRLNRISAPIFAKPIPQGTPRFFLDLIRRYPSRYVNGFARTVLLFAGVPGVESDNRSFREEVLSLTMNGSKIGDGPQPLQARIKQQFQQTTTPSVVLRALRLISPLYDRILIFASMMTVAGVFAALWLRHSGLFLLCVVPLVYLLGYAVLLVAIDRFMVPVYPIMLSNLILVPVLVYQKGRAQK